MTLRDRSDTPPPFTAKVAEALREASDDGMTALEIAEKLTDDSVPIAKATRMVRERIKALCRFYGYVIAYEPDEGEDRFTMVVDGERKRGAERVTDKARAPLGKDD
jgi:hypothetical protein